MGRIGSLHEWSRYLDAKSDDEASASLARVSREVDGLHDEVGRVASRLLDSPTGEVADVLLIARTALAEAAGMLDSVRARFDAGGRESA